MATMINLGDELIRLDAAKGTIEYSRNGGRTWQWRAGSTRYKSFTEIFQWNDEVLACAGEEIYASKDEGKTWSFRSRRFPGTFEGLYSSGNELMVTHNGNQYSSRDDGRTWNRLRWC